MSSLRKRKNGTNKSTGGSAKEESDREEGSYMNKIKRKREFQETDLNPKLKSFVQDNTYEINLSLPYKNKEIPTVITCPNCDFSKKCWIVLTHGAGGDHNTSQLKALAVFLAARDFTVVRFTCKGLNIKYRVKVYGEVLNLLHEKYGFEEIFIGGRSMGARAAVMLSSDTASKEEVLQKVMGVLCLSYPLHKVNNTSELRDEPLLELRKPAFFLSGTNDEMCERKRLEGILKSMTAPYNIHWLKGYDHSAKSTGNYEEDAYLKSFQDISDWCQKTYQSQLCS